jgi:hypothetical protein
MFAPPTAPYRSNWVEQILGSVLRPLVDEYHDAISWLWVTRYAGTYVEANPPRGYPLPPEFRSDGFYRYALLRLHADTSRRERVHMAALQLALQAGCYTPPDGWIPYDPVHDLGGDRFIRSDAHPEQRAERARLVANFVDSTIRLMLHSLAEGEDGTWVLEPNTQRAENPYGSFFESIRHLFFNATAVPTTVLLAGEWESLQLGTHWMHPVLIAGQDPLEFKLAVPVNY